MLVKMMYSQLKRNYLAMANQPHPDRFEWAFYLCIVAFVGFGLLSWTFTPGIIGGVFGGFAFAGIYGAFKIVWNWNLSHA